MLAESCERCSLSRAQLLGTGGRLTRRLESKTDDEQTLTVRIAALFGWEVQRLPFKVPATAAVPAERAVCSAADDDSCLLQCTLCGVCVPLWGTRFDRSSRLRVGRRHGDVMRVFSASGSSAA